MIHLCKTYESLHSPPQDWAFWEFLICTLTQHLAPSSGACEYLNHTECDDQLIVSLLWPNIWPPEGESGSVLRWELLVPQPTLHKKVDFPDSPGLLLPLPFSVLAQAHEMAKFIFRMGLNPFWKSSYKHSKVCQGNFLEYLNNHNPTKMTLMITHASYGFFYPLFLFWERGCAL